MAGAAVSSPASSSVSTAPGHHPMPMVRPGLSSSGPMSTISSPGAAVAAHAEAGPPSPWPTNTMSTSRASGRTARTV